MNYSRQAGVEAVAGIAQSVLSLQRYQKQPQHQPQDRLSDVVNHFFTSSSHSNDSSNNIDKYPSNSALPSLLAKNLSTFNGESASTIAFRDNDNQQQRELLLNSQQRNHLQQQTSSFHSAPLSLLNPLINTASDKQHLLSSLEASTTAAATSPSSSPYTSSQQQSFSDWWSEYWSRQPFPSGYTQSSITLLACLITTIIFLIVVGNLLVCIAIFTEKSLKPTQNWFIASLAVSDMLLGLVVMPFSLARELMGFWVFGSLWCDIHEAMDVLLTTASINTLCLISLDRYWSITQAVSYLKKRTPRRGAFMIAFVWILSAAVSLPPLFGWKKQSPTIPVSTNSTSNNNDINRTTTTATNSASINDDNFETTNSSTMKYGDSIGAAFVDQGGSDEPTGSDTSDSQQQDKAKKRRSAQQQMKPHNKATLTREWDQLAAPLLLGRRSELAEINNNQILIPSQKLSKIRRESQNDRDDNNYYQQQQQNSNSNNYNNNNNNQDQRDQYISSLTHLSYASTTSTPIIMTTTTTASPSFDQNNGYPSCQLTDDVGYVLYSALGSFFIPCAVMVFTYIKIFLAARSRARRAINKQSRAQGGANKRLAARRQVNTFSGAPITSGGGGGQMNDLSCVSGSLLTNNNYSVNSKAIMSQSSLVNNNTFQQSSGKGLNKPKSIEARKVSQDVPIMKGKIVIVERKKSLAASSLAPTVVSAASGDPSYQDGLVCVEGNTTKLSSRAYGGDLTESPPRKTSDDDNNEEEEEDDNEEEEEEGDDDDNDGSQEPPCTLTTSAAKQASQSALNSSASNDSSMITVMNASMNKVPVTRFSFQGPNKTEGEQQQAKYEQDKASALLKAISQGCATDDHLFQEVLSASDGEQAPDIVVDRRATVSCADNNSNNKQVVVMKDKAGSRSNEAAVIDDDSDDVDNQLMPNSAITTNETCFMTIEEDSDMYDAQAGRTIMMIAGNASQKQANNLSGGKGTQNIMMTMMPPTGTQTTSANNNQQQSVVCNSVLCRQRHQHQHQLQQSPNQARSASSYCGSSMTINDDDMDECVDDDMLTDDCNGYSVSCGLDHYDCPGTGSSCIHCNECEQEQNSSPNKHLSSLNDSPQSIGALCRHQHLQQRHQQADHYNQQQQQRSDQQKRRRQQQLATNRDTTNSGDVDERLSFTGLDDNVSHMTEYRSNEDLSSSIIGHDVLDATEISSKSDKKRLNKNLPSNSDERKKSLIGFRLTRLSSAAPLSNQSGGLLALASSQSQQASTVVSGGRNLKALRQNFFLKLNQLTAKSSAAKHEYKDKKSDPSSKFKHLKV